MITFNTPWLVVFSIALLAVYATFSLVNRFCRGPYRTTSMTWAGILSAALALIAFAEPIIQYSAHPTPVILLLDSSFTMRAGYGVQDRFTTQLHFAHAILSNMSSTTRVGIITFDKSVSVLAEDWLSPDEAIKKLYEIKVAETPRDTLLWDAIITSIQWGELRARDGIILLMTDGLDTEGDAGLLNALNTQWKVCPVLVGQTSGQFVLWDDQIYPITVDVTPLLWLSGRFNCPSFPIHADQQKPDAVYERLLPYLQSAHNKRDTPLFLWTLLASVVLPLIAAIFRVFRHSNII